MNQRDLDGFNDGIDFGLIDENWSRICLPCSVVVILKRLLLSSSSDGAKMEKESVGDATAVKVQALSVDDK